jgi:hypothetical protein
MLTHELAEALRKLAAALKRGPNVDVGQISLMEDFFAPSRRPRPRTEDLPLALNALLSLSRFDKYEWMDLIEALGLPIQVRARDASRDILGKVLKVLEQEPGAREQLERHVKAQRASASPELARALSSLLR